MTYLILISMLLVACKHTPPVVEPDTSYCYEWGGKYVEPSGNMGAYTLPDCPLDIECPEKHPQKMDFYSPCFNPNNPNQIAFVQYSLHTNAQPIATLCTFDMCTGEKKVLYAPCWSTPDWSVKDWIIFSGAGNQVFKIKPNGDSLTQLTSEGFNVKPFWNPKGSEFIVQTDNNKVYKYSHNLVKQQLIGAGGAAYLWLNDSIILQIRGSYNEIHSYNLNTQKSEIFKKYLKPYGGWEFLIRLSWESKTNSIIWLKMHQIGKTNVESKMDESIRYGADNRRYMDIDLSHDGKTLIVERQDTYTLDSVTRYVSSNLYLMDIKGMQERKILIPETP